MGSADDPDSVLPTVHALAIRTGFGWGRAPPYRMYRCRDSVGKAPRQVLIGVQGGAPPHQADTATWAPDRL